MQLPSGTVTFLFTDIEGSSRRWEIAPDTMAEDLPTHDDLVQDAVEAHEGATLKNLGDGVIAVFASATNALDAAIATQRAFHATTWADPSPMRIRIGLHTGDCEPLDDDYFGPTINRAARIADVANGDQIVCSAATAALCRNHGFRDVGVHQLRGVGAERLFVALVEGLDGDDQALRTSDVAESNLPLQLTEIIGRERELAELPARLRDHRLVTLIGPGGVGKTRLVLGVAGSMLEDFPGGVRFCELAPVGDPDAVAAAVAAGVGARQQTGMGLVQSIASYVEGRRTLIVLDNCEHVLDEVSRVVEGLLEVDGVTVVATSREPIGIPGEQLWSVAALDPNSTAIDLFVERARELDPHFDAGQYRDEMIEICRRLDGIPLAVELAAARIGLLTPADIADRLDDRFRLLRGSRRGPRHQTLLDTVQWSYDLLEPMEASLFVRLSVFAGDFTLDSAELVCADETIDALDVLDLLSVLVDKSMVVREKDGDGSRFSLLETLRQFGEEQLDAVGEGTDLRRRHARHYRDLAIEHDDRLHTVDEAAAWRAFDADWDNLRAAFEYSEQTEDVETAVELVLSLYWYAAYALRDEAFDWATEAMGWPGIESHPQYADLCGAAAIGAYLTVDPATQSLAEKGLAADSTDRRGYCRMALAAVFLNNLLDREASAALMGEWADLLDGHDTASSLWANGMHAFHHASLEPSPLSAEYAAATMRIARECGSPSALALGYWATGLSLVGTDPVPAIGALDAGLATAVALAPRHLIEHLIRGVLVHHRSRSERVEEGLESCRGALVAALDDHYAVGTSHLLGAAAHVLSKVDDAAMAARLVDTMIVNGHRPRGAVMRALEESGATATGPTLSVRDAAAAAVEAISQAQARILVDSVS